MAGLISDNFANQAQIQYPAAFAGTTQMHVAEHRERLPVDRRGRALPVLSIPFEELEIIRYQATTRKRKTRYVDGASISKCCTGLGMRYFEEEVTSWNKHLQGKDSILLRLDMWKGYEGHNWVHEIPLKHEGKPLLYWQLACVVGNFVGAFVEVRPPTTLHDLTDWDLRLIYLKACSQGLINSTDPNWSVGVRGKYPLEKIILNNIHTAGDGIWQTELSVYVNSAEFLALKTPDVRAAFEKMLGTVHE
ncbi:hypothetical protein H0H81_011268 [Sphagnurus paluster]|uniref:Uncharacterized protein n=1 Tax=Sphagnurus paluster TaxID=117069 RepID=A0A9P7GIN5_9AGAR|nr:hypothetical protein H0H81_011268 [Sphagnurus paluster]